MKLTFEQSQNISATGKNHESWDFMMAALEGMRSIRGDELTDNNIQSAYKQSAVIMAQSWVNEALKGVFRFYPADQYHEDMGPCIWYKVPVCEPPLITSPLSDDWIEDYYTHFLLLIPMPIPDENGVAISGNMNNRTWLPYQENENQ